MEFRDNMGLKHDTDDKRCRYNDGFKVSWMTALVMGICCNTCRSLPPVLKQKLKVQIGSIINLDGRLYTLTSYSKHSGGVMDPDGESEVVLRLDAVR